MTKGVVYHLHIPKTGGGTVLAVLREEYGHSDVLAIPARGGVRSVELRRTQGVSAVSGHFAYGLHEAWGDSGARYITFLRHPLDRAASLWGYIRLRGRAHRAFPLTERMTPQEFAETGPFDNGQVRMLAGRDDFQWNLPKRDLTEEDLLRAWDHLQSFVFAGDMARFGEEIKRLRTLMGWKDRGLPHVNASRRRPEIKMTPAFRDKWRWDLELYERVVEQ